MLAVLSGVVSLTLIVLSDEAEKPRRRVQGAIANVGLGIEADHSDRRRQRIGTAVTVIHRGLLNDEVAFSPYA